MKKYKPKKIEGKWQRYWEKLKIYQAKDFSKKKKFYLLVEFPYPSGDGLHVGHARSYTALDVIARKKRMEGFNVLFPIGWDAFGLPTENYALKTGLHPKVITKKNVAVFKKQIKSLGLSFDWSREINTTDPNYYKWTQWIFLKMFEKGLAYQAKIPINWCPSCKIGLANEEVIDNKCERCGTETEKKEIKQWLLKITQYADRLINDLNQVDYLEKIKTQQINWIGRSFGITIKFSIICPLQSISNSHQFAFVEVFTTRVDTIFGATALVVAPEHLLIENLKFKIENWQEVRNYVEAAKRKSDLERTDLVKEKTGVELKGCKAINPINNQEIPVFVGDYVIATYGGGAVMVVPAHDKRDFEFAKKYHLPIKEVVVPRINANQDTDQGGNLEEAFTEDGILVNSGEFSGLTSEKGREEITAWLEKRRLKKKTVQYKLRDWIFSRQHYWGEPIPLVFCQNCKELVENSKFQIPNLKLNENWKLKIGNYQFTVGELLNPGWIAVPESKLPVKLPYVKKYEPSGTGESPLAKIEKWVETKCPKCGGPAKRETDTMPNWAGSNWYYLAYITLGSKNAKIKNKKSIWDKRKIKYWMPVDWYNGGMEHTNLHLLYSRFVYKFLYDIGIVPQSEPYKKRIAHGIILAEDGQKMSKSFGNAINPDEIIKNYGADTLRGYELFIGPYDQTATWQTHGVKGVFRFLERVWILVLDCFKNKKSSLEIERAVHQLNKTVNDDLEKLKFNTIMAAFMEFVNFASERKNEVGLETIKRFLLLLAPFVPYLSEELWQRMLINADKSVNKRARNQSKFASIFQESWPHPDEKLIKRQTFTLIIQVNGRVRDYVEVPVDVDEKGAKEIAISREKIKKWLANQKIKKIVFVPQRLINIVV